MVYGVGFRVLNLESRIEGLGFRGEGFGLRVWESGF
jgi:hypothetical protein